MFATIGAIDEVLCAYGQINTRMWGAFITITSDFRSVDGDDFIGKGHVQRKPVSKVNKNYAAVSILFLPAALAL